VETPGRPADRRCPGTIKDPEASGLKINYQDGGSRLSLGGSVYDPNDAVGRLLFNVLAMVESSSPT